MKIFITGSSDGLGKLAAIDLLKLGHQVILHARNDKRKQKTLNDIPFAEKVLIADLSKLNETKTLSAELNALGTFDAIIHNAGASQVSKSEILNVNCLSPYILTSLVNKPKRLIYIGSGLHRSGTINLKTLSDGINYSDSKLYLLMLSMLVARKWPQVYSNIVNPGWVPTKMGGKGAPDDLQKGYETQVWLAISNDPKVKVSGKYFYHKKETEYSKIATDSNLQDEFIQLCEYLTGVHFPD